MDRRLGQTAFLSTLIGNQAIGSQDSLSSDTSEPPPLAHRPRCSGFNSPFGCRSVVLTYRWNEVLHAWEFCAFNSVRASELFSVSTLLDCGRH